MGDKEENQKARKKYVKPEVRKHKAVQIVSASESTDCSKYRTRVTDTGYWH